MLGLKLNHVSKSGPRAIAVQCLFCDTITQAYMVGKIYSAKVLTKLYRATRILTATPWYTKRSEEVSFCWSSIYQIRVNALFRTISLSCRTCFITYNISSVKTYIVSSLTETCLATVSTGISHTDRAIVSALIIPYPNQNCYKIVATSLTTTYVPKYILLFYIVNIFGFIATSLSCWLKSFFPKQ